MREVELATKLLSRVALDGLASDFRIVESVQRNGPLRNVNQNLKLQAGP